jgi:hypothetical protein
VLKHHDFISSRIYVTIDQEIEKRNLIEEVYKDSGRYSVGLYPIGYEMMLNGLGIWRVYRHNAKRKGVSVLGGRVHKMQRFLIAKKNEKISERPYKRIVVNYLNTMIESGWNESLQI